MASLPPFLQATCLSSGTLTIDQLYRADHGVDRRYPAMYFERFQRLNARALHFLGVEVTGTEEKTRSFTTSQYIGQAPLRSPASGLPIGDLAISSRYNEDITDVVPLLEDYFTPEFAPDIELSSDMPVQPPMLLECAKYVDLFAMAVRRPWQKLTRCTALETRPNSGTDWQKYAADSADPGRRLQFTNHNNTLSTDHTQWRELTYVLTLALDRLRQCAGTRRNLQPENMTRMEQYVLTHPALPTQKITPHAPDPHIIKELKNSAAQILNHTGSKRCAWRIDFELFFERYTQYICHCAAERRGARAVSNQKISIRGNRPSWALAYLEPDILVVRGAQAIPLDAKYKSHMLNTDTSTTALRDAFRADLHQVLAYAALTQHSDPAPRAFLLYPGRSLRVIPLKIASPYGTPELTVTLLSLPISRRAATEAATTLAPLLFPEN